MSSSEIGGLVCGVRGDRGMRKNLGSPGVWEGESTVCRDSSNLGGKGSGERLHPSPTGFLGGSAGKESTCNAGHLGLIPGLRRSPGEGNSYTLQ